MKAIIYFNYSSCISREVEIENEEDIDAVIDDLRCCITDEEVISGIQENSYDIQLIDDEKILRRML